MSAPLMWIGVPAIGAVVLWFVHPKSRLSLGIASGLCVALALLAWQAPLGAPIRLGTFSFEINTTFLFLGRKFVIDGGDRVFLILTYAAGAIWFIGSESARVNRFFIPVGLLFLALLVAAQSVEPFLYAALMIEIGVLISIPVLVSTRSHELRGIQRYLVFQTFALPFVLFSGWLAGIVAGSTASSALLSQAALFLSMGLALWLAVFPLNTWVPQLVSESHPYSAGLILTILPTAVFFLNINFLDTFGWLKSNPALPTFLQVGGVVTVVTSGIWAAYQNDLRRLFGYGLIFENSFFILALLLDSKVAVQLFYMNFIPRLMGFAAWSLALTVLERHGVSKINELPGVFLKLPFASLALLVAYFSMTGLPLSASFAARQVIVGNLPQGSSVMVAWIFVGMIGFAIGGIRLLLNLVDLSTQKIVVTESKFEAILLMIGMILLLGLGIIPR